MANINTPLVLLWNKLTFAGATSMALSLALTLCFVTELPISRLKTKIYYVGAVIFIVASLFTSFVVKSVSPTYSQEHDVVGFIPDRGILYPLLLLFIIYVIVTTFFALIKAYKVASVQRRVQIQYVSTTFIIATGGTLLTNAFLPLLFKNPNISSLGPVNTLFIICALSYLIIRHKLFDIRAAIARTLAYLFTFSVLVALYAVVVFGIGSLISIGPNLDTDQRLFYIGVALVFALTLPRLRRTFDKLTNRIFYQDAYDPQEFISELNKTIVGDIHIKKLLEECSDVIMSHLKVGFCIFGLKETESLPIRIIGKQPTSFKKQDIETVRRLTPHIQQKVILADELEAGDQELKDELSKYDIGALVRLTTNVTNGKEGVGYIALGYKRSGSIFNSVDVKTLEIVANELVIAIQNAMQFEEIQQFNITLQQKVKEATHELEKTNKKLIAMDETKDEFISMASHQLRTPLTSVKGFLSMLLDGDFGKVTPKQHEILKETFASSQRMVYLIADFLNVSRIRTGKFVIELTEVDLSEIITQELNQLQEMAASREVTLKFEAPVDFPKAMLDENKIRQVMMNFIDNAIYYTPKGGTTNIQLYKTAKDIVYKVIDNGIGVPKSEQHKLFTKFFRAKNAQKARPDGTGLGLFMAQKVIVAQGGSIIFESTEGKGSTFGFSFPLSKVKLTK